MRRYALRADQWDRIAPLLPGKATGVGVTAADNRLFVEAVLCRYRVGIPWRDLPERFGGDDPHTSHALESQGCFSCFQCIGSGHRQWTRDDRQHDRAGASASGRGERLVKKTAMIERSRGGLSTRIHAACDALGNPTGFHLMPGRACDPGGSDVLLDGIKAGIVIAGKGYDAHERVIDRLKAAEIEPVVPSKSNRKEPREYDKALYKSRHLIELFFEKLKQYRAVATGCDKTATAFLGATHLATSIIWLN